MKTIIFVLFFVAAAKILLSIKKDIDFTNLGESLQDMNYRIYEKAFNFMQKYFPCESALNMVNKFMDWSGGNNGDDGGGMVNKLGDILKKAVGNKNDEMLPKEKKTK